MVIESMGSDIMGELFLIIFILLSIKVMYPGFVNNIEQCCTVLCRSVV